MSRNAALLLAARVTSALTTLVVLGLIAHWRGSEALGLVAIGFASGQILAVLSELGLAAFLIREGARTPDRAGEMLGGMLLLRAVTVPPVLFGAWLLSSAATDTEPLTIWLAATGLVLQSAADLTRAASLSQRRGGMLAAHAMTENLLWVVVVAALLFQGASTATALAGGVVVLAVSIVAGVVLVRLRLGIRLALPSAGRAKALLRDARPFAVFSLFATAQYRLDTVLVSALVPAGSIVAAGAYFSAQRLLAAFEYVPETLSLSLVPDVTRAFQSGRSEMAAVLGRPARLLLYLGIPIPFAIYVGGSWVFGLFFSSELGSYSWLLVGLSVLVPFRFFQWLAGAALTGANAQWKRVAGAGLAVIAVVTIDALLLPQIGVAAAILGAAAGTAIVVTVYARGLFQIVGHLWPARDLARALIASIASLVVGVAIGPALGPFAAVLGFAVAYSCVVVLLLRLPVMGRGRRA